MPRVDPEARRARWREYARHKREEHPERERERARQRYAASPERTKERARRRREENPEREKGRSLRYRAKNREHERERARQWYEANPEASRNQCALRRARKRNAPRVERVDRLVVLKRHEGVCGICGESVDPFDFHVDHIFPLSRGGDHTYANTQPAHPLCNMRKHATLPEPSVTDVTDPRPSPAAKT